MWALNRQCLMQPTMLNLNLNLGFIILCLLMMSWCHIFVTSHDVTSLSLNDVTIATSRNIWKEINPAIARCCYDVTKIQTLPMCIVKRVNLEGELILVKPSELSVWIKTFAGVENMLLFKFGWKPGVQNLTSIKKVQKLYCFARAAPFWQYLYHG